MLREQPREVASPYSEASGQCGDAVLVKSCGFDQDQSPLDRGPRALPGRAEGRRFRSATEARPVSSAFCCGRACIEKDVAREWCAHAADRPAIDTGRLDRRKHHTVEGWVASLQSQITGVEVNHALVLHAKPRSRERAVMIRSENGCYCEGFRMTAHRDNSACTRAVVRKPPGKERAGDEVPTVTRALWRFDRGFDGGRGARERGGQVMAGAGGC